MSTKLPQPEVQVIKLHKNSNGMGLSIVAAKGAGQVCASSEIFIYIRCINLNINDKYFFFSIQ